MEQKGYFRNYNCWIKGNKFKFANLKNPRLVTEFINSIKRLHLKFHHKKIILDFNEVDSIYPYPTVAISGYMHYFKECLGVEFELINVPTYLSNINFENPIEVSKTKIKKYTNCLNKIWMFKNADEVHSLVNGVLANIRREIECEPSIIDGCTWGLNEIMDNVIQHSETNIGFIMAAIQKRSKNINICIFDYGIGIYRSIKNSNNDYNPRTAADAISLAIKEGVTRDKNVGQGNGMWGLYNIINLNTGHVGIISGKGSLNMTCGKVKTSNDNIMLSPQQQATTVYFQLNYEKEINIMEAIGGHELVDLYIENMEDEYDRIIFKISDATSGTGTRQSGLKIKNEVINLYKKAKKPIVIDFSDISIIASSFADEFIGKLVVELGFYQFQKIFKLENMNNVIDKIVQRSLSQRMAQSIKD